MKSEVDVQFIKRKKREKKITTAYTVQHLQDLLQF